MKDVDDYSAQSMNNNDICPYPTLLWRLRATTWKSLALHPHISLVWIICPSYATANRLLYLCTSKKVTKKLIKTKCTSITISK